MTHDTSLALLPATTGTGVNKPAAVHDGQRKEVSIQPDDREIRALKCAMRSFINKMSGFRLSGDICVAVQRCIFGCEMLQEHTGALNTLLSDIKKQIQHKISKRHQTIRQLMEKGYQKACDRIKQDIQNCKNSMWWVDVCAPEKILRKLADCCHPLKQSLRLNSRWQKKFQTFLENPLPDAKIHKLIKGDKYEREVENLLKEASKNTTFSVYANVHMTNKMIPEGV